MLPPPLCTSCTVFLGSELDDFIVIFLDDVLVYSRDLSSHVAHVRRAFEILRQHSLFAKVSKCEFSDLVYITWATL